MVARQDVVGRRSAEVQDLAEDVQVALPRKGGPFQLDQGKDAATAPDADLVSVLGSSDQRFGRAVVDGHDVPGVLALLRELAAREPKVRGLELPRSLMRRFRLGVRRASLTLDVVVDGVDVVEDVWPACGGGMYIVGVVVA